MSKKGFNELAISESQAKRMKTIESIRKIKGWENATDDEAIEVNCELEKLATILIEGLPGDRLDRVIEEINRKKGVALG